MDHLNMKNLSETWPLWKQKFEINLFANYDENISDRRKLALFLNSVGPGGMQLVNRLFPELMQFNAEAAIRLSFAEIWTAFDKHCRLIAALTGSQSTASGTAINNEPSEERTFNCITCGSSYNARQVLNQLGVARNTPMQKVPQRKRINIRQVQEPSILTLYHLQ